MQNLLWNKSIKHIHLLTFLKTGEDTFEASRGKFHLPELGALTQSDRLLLWRCRSQPRFISSSLLCHSSMSHSSLKFRQFHTLSTAPCTLSLPMTSSTSLMQMIRMCLLLDRFQRGQITWNVCNRSGKWKWKLVCPKYVCLWVNVVAWLIKSAFCRFFSSSNDNINTQVLF